MRYRLPVEWVVLNWPAANSSSLTIRANGDLILNVADVGTLESSIPSRHHTKTRDRRLTSNVVSMHCISDSGVDTFNGLTGISIDRLSRLARIHTSGRF